MEKQETIKSRWRISLGELLVVISIILVLVSFLLPSVNRHGGASRRIQDINNLKQISLAMHNYYAAYNQFPEDIKNEQGEPILSWRVRMLPYLDQVGLYRAFDLTKPWDSPENIEFASMVLSVYQLPHREDSVVDGIFHTGYQLPVGQEESGSPRIFRSENGIARFEEIKDGFGQTIMVVAAKSEYKVPWTKPGDYQFDPENPHEGMGEYYPGLYLRSCVDGSARTLSTEIPDEELLGLFTINGGEPPPKQW